MSVGIDVKGACKDTTSIEGFKTWVICSSRQDLLRKISVTKSPKMLQLFGKINLIYNFKNPLQLLWSFNF